MKCQSCGCVVTQNEADEAHAIIDSGVTLCPECATTMAESDEPFGLLMEYDTAKEIRPATKDERDESRDAATRDGGSGVISVDGVSCYVQEQIAETWYGQCGFCGLKATIPCNEQGHELVDLDGESCCQECYEERTGKPFPQATERG